jgi:uncharacterized membrane protein
MSEILTARRDDAPASEAKSADPSESARENETAAKTVTINRDPRDLYDFWRDFGNLVAVLENVRRIERIDDRRTRWVVKAPTGTVQWVTAVVDDQPGRLIAWESEPGADVRNSGRVEFLPAPGGRGSWVRATIHYDTPGGLIGKIAARLFQREPAIQARRDLRRFKQLMETGEIATGARTHAQREQRGE